MTTYQRNLVQATTYNLEELKSIIQNLDERFGTDTEPTMYGPKLNDKVYTRRAHFHNLKEADPDLPPPYDKGSKFQSDVPRRVHKDLKARICENSYRFEVQAPKDTEAGRTQADQLKITLQNGFENVEQRHQFSLQADLSDGQIVDGPVFLHWNRNDAILPDMPDYDELDELTEGQEANYTEDDYAPVEGKPQRTKSKKFRETDDSLQTRMKFQQALAGFPYDLEVIAMPAVTWQEDRSIKNGLARVVVKRTSGILDYARRIDGEAYSEHDANPDVKVWTEVEAPASWMPSGDSWGDILTCYQVWTCDEYYELACDAHGSAWELVKSFEHDWKMPPFVKVYASHFNSPDPVLAYEPALEGVFRVKPFYDYHVSLERSTAESVALPFYYLAKIDANSPDFDDEGKDLFFTKNAALAMKVPDGYKLEQLIFQINPAFVELGKDLKQDLIDAIPSTGKAQFSVDTKPWAAQMEQEQESQEPARYMKNQALALQICAKSIAQDMSQRDTPVYVFGQTKNGKLDPTTVIGIEPDQIKSLDIDVAISSVSSAQKVTLMQVGKELLDDPLVPITPETFLTDYMLDEDAQATMADWIAWRVYTQYVEPGKLKQLVSKVYGSDVVYAPDGAFVGSQGQQMSPEQVIQANGQQPLPPNPQTGQPVQQGQSGPPVGQQNGAMQPPPTHLNAMPPLQAPGTLALPGRPM